MQGMAFDALPSNFVSTVQQSCKYALMALPWCTRTQQWVMCVSVKWLLPQSVMLQLNVKDSCFHDATSADPIKYAMPRYATLWHAVPRYASLHHARPVRQETMPLPMTDALYITLLRVVHEMQFVRRCCEQHAGHPHGSTGNVLHVGLIGFYLHAPKPGLHALCSSMPMLQVDLTIPAQQGERSSW